MVELRDKRLIYGKVSSHIWEFITRDKMILYLMEEITHWDDSVFRQYIGMILNLV